jgi:hypothetical protein
MKAGKFQEKEFVRCFLNILNFGTLWGKAVNEEFGLNKHNLIKSTKK